MRAAQSFDNLVGAAEQRERERDAKRVGCLEVEEQLDLGGLLHRQVGGFLAFENTSRVGPDQTIRYRGAAAVAHQAAGRGELAKLEDGRHPMAGGERAKLPAPVNKQAIVTDHE